MLGRAVTLSERQKLVKALAVAKSFDRGYPAGSQAWFVDRVARGFDAQGLSDADITTRTTDVVTRSKVLVKAKRGFTVGLGFGKARRAVNAGRAIEILYGAIAWNPQLLDAANADFFDFIARRRLRSVARMDWWVNPNHQGFFRYPDTCPADTRWRTNIGAATYWEHANAGNFPIVVKRPGGVTPNLVSAVASIWVKKSKPCEGNLLDCATTTATVLMDSLVEAKTPATLLSKIDAKKPDNLAINHVNAATDAFFATDSGGEGLFSKASRLVEDLELGDHAYIYNHPLYKVFKPTGSWRGEHSLVFNGGDRTIKSKHGILFGGHGKIGTVYDFYDDFLIELQTDLHRAYRIGAIFLAWLTSGKTLFPGQVTSSNQTMTLGSTPNVAYELHELSVSYKFNNYKAAPSKSGPAQRSETGFVIAYVPSLNRFYIAEKKHAADVLAAGPTRNAIPIERSSTVPAGGEFDPVNWAVTYNDPSTATKKRYDLFQRKKAALAFQPLTIDALFESPFLKRDPKKEEVATTTPRISFVPAYQTFLKVNGAT